MADLSTFEFFQKESSHEDVEVRQEAFEQISLICGLIGADQCREVQLGLYDQQWLVIIYTNMYTQVPHHNP